MIKKLLKLEFNSAFLRKILSLYYKSGKVYSVKFGPLKGTKLIYSKDINYHAILGLWERDALDILLKIIDGYFKDKKVNILDVGGNIGTYSLFFDRYLSHGSKIFTLEPGPINETLRKNLELNNIDSVTLLPLACGAKKGETEFYIGHHHKSSLDYDWTSGQGRNEIQSIKVKVDSIDNLVNDKRILPPHLIKMDIEGGGVYALPGAYNTLKNSRPIIIIESHNEKEDRAISDVLLNCNYQAYRIDNSKWVSNLSSIHPDTEGVWGTLLLIPDEMKNSFIQKVININYSK